MRRYLFPDKIELNESLQIEGDLFKHIFKACRRTLGDKFELLSDGSAYLVEVVAVEKSSASVSVLEVRKMVGLGKPYIHLVLANPKPSVYEKVVEKAVELGVKSVFTVSSENSFFKTADKIKLKENRIKKIMNQAMQQSNRAEELILEEPQSLDAFFESFKSDSSLGVMLYEAKVGGGGLQPLKDLEPLEDCYILVGGEGGFTEEEASKACSVGFTAVLMGPQILRVETACVAGISILKFALRAW